MLTFINDLLKLGKVFSFSQFSGVLNFVFKCSLNLCTNNFEDKLFEFISQIFSIFSIAFKYFLSSFIFLN